VKVFERKKQQLAYSANMIFKSTSFQTMVAYLRHVVLSLGGAPNENIFRTFAISSDVQWSEITTQISHHIKVCAFSNEIWFIFYGEFSCFRLSLCGTPDENTM
jgi:hypothetical protein